MSHNLRVPSLFRVRSLRAAAVVAAAGAAVVAVSGCTSDPGAAALIGNTRISDTQLHDAVDAALSDPTFAQTVGSARASLVREELANMIVLRLFQAQAAQDRVTVTPTQVNNQIALFVHQAGSRSQLDAELAQNGQPPADLFQNIEENLLLNGIVSKQTGDSKPSTTELQAIGLKVLKDQTARLGVHVSPRYGSWNPAAPDVIPVASELSVAANAPSTQTQPPTAPPTQPPG